MHTVYVHQSEYYRFIDLLILEDIVPKLDIKERELMLSQRSAIFNTISAITLLLYGFKDSVSFSVVVVSKRAFLIQSLHKCVTNYGVTSLP